MARSHEDRSHRGGESRQSRGTPQSNLDDRSLDELRQLASDLNIEGRNRLDREQLIQEIERERETQERGSNRGGEDRGTGYRGTGREQEEAVEEPTVENFEEDSDVEESDETGKQRKRR